MVLKSSSSSSRIKQKLGSSTHINEAAAWHTRVKAPGLNSTNQNRNKAKSHPHHHTSDSASDSAVHDMTPRRSAGGRARAELRPVMILKQRVNHGFSKGSSGLDFARAMISGWVIGRSYSRYRN